MKIVVTGHTRGLGKSIYDHFLQQGHYVIGMSRSCGYNVSLIEDYKRIVEEAKTSSLFFNNAYFGTCQANFLKSLFGFTTIITSGSMAADSPNHSQYCKDKSEIERVHKRLIKSNPCPMLLLKLGYLENHTDKPFRVIKYREVLDYLDFWLLNTKVSLIEFDNNLL